MFYRFLNRWHDWLAMPKFDKAWHQSDMSDELAEYHEETKLVKKWSEASDVVYTYTRSRWSGHALDFPLGKTAFCVGLVYMIPKYSGRFLFFRTAGRRVGATPDIRCVRNPKKLHKLDGIISHQQIKVDQKKLKTVCQSMLKGWPLLP